MVKLTNCIVCGCTLLNGVKDITYLYGAELLDIEDAPIKYCPECEKSYLTEENKIEINEMVAKYNKKRGIING